MIGSSYTGSTAGPVYDAPRARVWLAASGLHDCPTGTKCWLVREGGAAGVATGPSCAAPQPAQKRASGAIGMLHDWHNKCSARLLTMNGGQCGLSKYRASRHGRSDSRAASSAKRSVGGQSGATFLDRE